MVVLLFRYQKGVTPNHAPPLNEQYRQLKRDF